MKKFLQISILFILAVLLFTGCGPSRTDLSKDVKAPPAQHTANSVQTEDLKNIKITTNIDWDAKKGNLTKYVAVIKNESDRQFSGKVTIIPSTGRISETADIDIPSLLPGEQKIFIAFAEIKTETQFEYKIAGNFSAFDKKSALNYKIIKTISGNNYMTFWIYATDNSEDNLVAISKEMRQKYSSLALGFQIRFFETESPSDISENIAAYALTKNLKISKLSIFKSDEEINID